MEVLVGSVSGGHFPYQLTALIKLCCNKYRPMISIGGSGGAVSIYCASAANWNPSGIERVASSLNNTIFIDEWATFMHGLVPGYMSSYFRGSMYKSSDKSHTLLNTYFTRESIMDDEIWLAASNEGTGNVALFCNKNRSDALIKGELINRSLCNCEPIRYQGGDIDKVAKSIAATSSIPMFVEPVEMDGYYYNDCGVRYGSPLTPLYDELKDIQRKDGIHITYLSGYNTQSSSKVNSNIKKGTGNIIHHLKTVPGHTVRSLVEQDRRCAYEIISDACKTQPNYKEFRLDELSSALSLKEDSRSSLMEIYPISEESIDLFSFTGRDLVNFIDNCTDRIGIRMWYTAGDTLTGL